MTATEAQGHRWVRKDFDVQDGPKYEVQTVKMRRFDKLERTTIFRCGCGYL